MSKKFKFSIVIAIYNMEHYLTETIDSILNQTIGFEDNLQILLVNDGSVDQSEKLCKSYAEKYPENIIYIWKKNGGVSEARNKGLEYASGELVNFLDADDKLSLDAFEKVYTFYNENKEEVDLISIPLYFFEGKEGEHILNGKFTRTRVIDIFKEPKCFQMHISSSFIKLETMKQYVFNPLLKFGEDAEVANKIILSKGKYGVVVDTKYWYRRRSAGNSAIQGAKSNKENYIPALKYLHLELIRFAKEKYCEVPAYLQWMLVYDLGWKIRVPYVEESVLDQGEIEEFLNYVKQVLENVTDEIILANSYLKRCYYRYFLDLKYDGIKKEQLMIIRNQEEAVLCKENQVIDILSLQTIKIEKIEVRDNNFHFWGSFNMSFDQYDVRLVIEQDGKEVNVPYYIDEKGKVTSLNQLVEKGYGFEVKLSIDRIKTNLRVKSILGNTKAPLKIVFKKDDQTVNDLELENYRVKCKNKVLEIERIIGTEEKNKRIINNETIIEKKEIASLIMLYKKNMKPNMIEKLTEKIKLAQLKSLADNLDDNEILSIPENQIPFSYRYFLLKNIKYNGKFELNIATIYNQAFLYNHNKVIIQKGKDITIKIVQCSIDKMLTLIKGNVVSPFFTNRCKLYCNSNSQSFECTLKKKDDKSEKWFGQSVMESYDFEIAIPLQDRNEIEFIVKIGIADILVKLKWKEDEVIKKLDASGFTVKILNKKKLILFIDTF